MAENQCSTSAQALSKPDSIGFLICCDVIALQLHKPPALPQCKKPRPDCTNSWRCSRRLWLIESVAFYFPLLIALRVLIMWCRHGNRVSVSHLLLMMCLRSSSPSDRSDYLTVGLRGDGRLRWQCSKRRNVFRLCGCLKGQITIKLHFPTFDYFPILDKKHSQFDSSGSICQVTLSAGFANPFQCLCTKKVYKCNLLNTYSTTQDYSVPSHRNSFLNCSIHPSIFHAEFFLGQLQPCPAVVWWRQGDSLDMWPGFWRAKWRHGDKQWFAVTHTQTYGQFRGFYRPYMNVFSQ